MSLTEQIESVLKLCTMHNLQTRTVKALGPAFADERAVIDYFKGLDSLIKGEETLLAVAEFISTQFIPNGCIYYATRSLSRITSVPDRQKQLALWESFRATLETKYKIELVTRPIDVVLVYRIIRKTS